MICFGSQVVEGLRDEVSQRCLELLAAMAFQACSFNHSDISPFRINGLRSIRQTLSHTPATSEVFLGSSLQSVSSTRVAAGARKLCQTSQCAAITYGFQDSRAAAFSAPTAGLKGKAKPIR